MVCDELPSCCYTVRGGQGGLWTSSSCMARGLETRMLTLFSHFPPPPPPPHNRCLSSFEAAILLGSVTPNLKLDWIEKLIEKYTGAVYSFLGVCPTILLLNLNVSSFFRTAELREKIETVNGEIQQLDMDLEEHQGNWHLIVWNTVYLYVHVLFLRPWCQYVLKKLYVVTLLFAVRLIVCAHVVCHFATACFFEVASEKLSGLYSV